VIWAVIGALSVGLVWLTLLRNTVFALGLIAGVTVGSASTAHGRLSGVTAWTVVTTLSTGIVIATVSLAVLSGWWLPSVSTTTGGYVIGIMAAWLLVSGVSLGDIGPFAAIGGLLIAVIGGAVGVLLAANPLLFITFLFAGLLAGFLIPVGGLLFGSQTNGSGSPHRSTNIETLEPATRFGIELAAVAGLVIVVPFGSRAVALFGYGRLGLFPIGVLCGVGLSSGVWTVVGGRSEQLGRLRDRFVERVYRLVDRLDRWIQRHRRRGAERNAEESPVGEPGSETAASGEAEPVSTASNLVDQAAIRLADRGLVIEAANRLELLAENNSGIQDRLGLFWGRLSGAVATDSISSGPALQLSAAEEASRAGNTKEAQSMTDAALELAAPTIGSVSSAILRGRRRGTEELFDTLAPLLARIETLLGEEALPREFDNDADQFQLIQRVLQRLVDEEAEGFDTALSTIRAAAADGWYSVQAGDRALENGNYHRALVAYLAGIRAYRRAYDIAANAEKTASQAAVRGADRSEKGSQSTSGGTGNEKTVTGSPETYASEANQLSTAIEAVLHDTAAVVIAATNELYGDDPPPTVDTEVRRTIVRGLRELRQTRTRIDAPVPPVDLADDRYQRAEIGRSIARLRRHLSSADEAAAAGKIETAAEQYDRVADRLDVLSNRAGNAGLINLARSLMKAAGGIGRLATEPTAEAIADRPDLTVPSTTDHRAPAVSPVSNRLRRTFCEPALVELLAVVGEAADHELLEMAGEPYPELVGSVELSIAGLDPLYTAPDVDALSQWVTEVCLDALSAAVERLSERHSEIAAVGPPPVPPAFSEPPAVLHDDAVASVSTAEGVDGFGEAWLSRATALVEASKTIERRAAAVDGFPALEPRIRETLQQHGSLDTTRVSPELLVVAAHRLSGVDYDIDTQRLLKTGDIATRVGHEVVEEAVDEETDETTGDDQRPSP
jgi:hypothetical protein